MKVYDYSKSFQHGKTFAKVMFIFFTLVLVIASLTSIPKESSSNFEYIIKLTFLPLMPLAIVYFYFSYSDISINHNGLYLEFIGRKLFVPWSDIMSIRHYGTQKFGFWLVTTKSNKLTFFHRLYTLFCSLQLSPGFLIHREISDREELISIIQRRGKE